MSGNNGEHRAREPETPLGYAGPDPLDPLGGPSGAPQESGEGVVAFMLSLLCPLLVCGGLQVFAAGALCCSLPVAVVVGGFVVYLAVAGLRGGGMDRAFAGWSLAVLAMTLCGLVVWGLMRLFIPA